MALLTEIGFWVLAAAMSFTLAWCVAAPLRRDDKRARFILLGSVPLAALLLYLALGTRGVADAPLAARLAGPIEQLPMAAVIARLDMRLRAAPADSAAWRLMAKARARNGAYAHAADAWRRHIELAGGSAEAYSGLAQSLISEDDGLVSAAALAFLQAAKTLQPDHAATRYWLGTAYAQQNAATAALAEWRPLLAALPDAAPLKRVLNAQIAALAEQQ